MVGIGASFTPWISWAVCLGLLAGAWAIVAVAVGSQLPQAVEGSSASIVTMDGPTTVRRTARPLWIERKTPCTDEIVSLELALVLEVTSKLDGEWASFAVQARLAPNESSSAPAQIVPVRAHYGFSFPQDQQTGHVYRLQTPILGLTAPVELIVPLEQGMDSWNRPIVQPGQVELTCV